MYSCCMLFSLVDDTSGCHRKKYVIAIISSNSGNLKVTFKICNYVNCEL